MRRTQISFSLFGTLLLRTLINAPPNVMRKPTKRINAISGSIYYNVSITLLSRSVISEILPTPSTPKYLF